MNKDQEKNQLLEILAKPLKKNDSGEKAKEILNSHIGFKREKEKYNDYVYLYSAVKDGKFHPHREIVCYAGAPGTGKTTFVKTLNEAMGRKLRTIACAGLKEFRNYSILGSDDKPSLVAWAIKESGCKNPIILLDELEKVSNEQIQRDLIELFKIYTNEKEGKQEKTSRELFDKYYQMNIKLDHITFFATVNYPNQLVPLLKKEMEMRKLEDYSDEEKEKILRLKKDEIEERIGEKNIIPEDIIKALPKYIREAGIRQGERVLYTIEKQYIVAKENGQEFSLGDPRKWLERNVFPYQESFSPSLKHYLFLFPLWVIIWVLLLVVIIKKVILRENSSKN